MLSCSALFLLVSLGCTTDRTLCTCFCMFISQPFFSRGGGKGVLVSVSEDEDQTLLCTLPRTFPFSRAELDPSVIATARSCKSSFVARQVCSLSSRAPVQTWLKPELLPLSLFSFKPNPAYGAEIVGPHLWPYFDSFRFDMELSSGKGKRAHECLS